MTIFKMKRKYSRIPEEDFLNSSLLRNKQIEMKINDVTDRLTDAEPGQIDLMIQLRAECLDLQLWKLGRP